MQCLVRVSCGMVAHLIVVHVPVYCNAVMSAVTSSSLTSSWWDSRHILRCVLYHRYGIRIIQSMNQHDHDVRSATTGSIPGSVLAGDRVRAAEEEGLPQ